MKQMKKIHTSPNKHLCCLIFLSFLGADQYSTAKTIRDDSYYYNKYTYESREAEQNYLNLKESKVSKIQNSMLEVQPDSYSQPSEVSVSFNNAVIQIDDTESPPFEQKRIINHSQESVDLPSQKKHALRETFGDTALVSQNDKQGATI